MEIKNEIPFYNIVVLGANGGIGKQVVEQALNNGHSVTAILRNPANLKHSHPNLIIAKGDVMQPDTLQVHLKNKDVVISAIGKNSFQPTTLYSHGNKNLLAEMEKAGIKRAFFISASGLEVNPTHSLVVKLATRYILQKLLRNMYADIRIMEKYIKESDTNWTIMRPPRLIDKPVTGKYRVSIDAILNNALTISRADLAHFMIHNIGNESIYKTTVELGY